MVYNSAGKHFVIYISKRFPRAFGIVYLLILGVMILALSFFPYVCKAFCYSCLYGKQQVSGVIEDIIVQKDVIRVRNSHTSFSTYYFLIDNSKVWVTPSIADEYEEGDVYEYFQYIRGNKIAGECFDYTLAGGLLGLLLEIGIVYMAVICFVTDVSDKGDGMNAKKGTLPLPKEYKNFSTKKLYELCLSNHVQILDGKRLDRKYLERRLRNADDRCNPYLRKMKAEKSEKSGILQVLGILCCAGSILCLSYFMYYFLYSFM